MSIFREWWTFLKLPFTRKINQDLEVLRMKHILFKGYYAMCWCGALIIRPGDDVYKSVENHENIHLQQARIEGSWFKFYSKYLLEYLYNLLFLWLGFSGAYFCISYEMQAYGNEYDFDYTVSKDNLGLHRIKNKRKVWKENKGRWKTYCKLIEL